MAEGVWQLKLPVPFPLRFVSVYLVEGDDGWTLVDAGYDYPPARVAWGLETMRREILDCSKTPYEVSRIVFRGTLTEHQRCFALAETLAHLDHLVLEGRAQRVQKEEYVAYRTA